MHHTHFDKVMTFLPHFFFNLEVNLYTNIELDYKSYEIKESIKKIVKTIFKNNINENKYFDFSTSKKETN